MSFAGNPYVSLTAQPAAGNYALQLQQLQRQQQIAAQEREEAMSPIPVQQGGGAPAPIAWTSVLAKALQSGAGLLNERGVAAQLKQLGVQDQQSAQDLINALTRKTNQVGTPDMSVSTGPINATAPQLPGGPAPAPQTANVALPGQQGAGVQQVGPSNQDQMAALMAAHGGPQTQMIQQAMLPYAMNRQALSEDRAYQEQQLQKRPATMQEKQAAGIDPRTPALIDIHGNISPITDPNQLTAAQAATLGVEKGRLGVEQGQLAETRRYHNMMGGLGMTENGMPNPAITAFRDQIAAGNATLTNVPAMMRPAVAMALNNTPKALYSPLAGSRFTMESSRITKPLTSLPQYNLTANGLPYLQRIDAALKTPGSVSDQDLLDSLTKLNTAGNAVTDAQVRIITDGKSFKDWANVIANKFKTGGVLSNDQRQQIKEIANHIYDNYKKGYQPVYDQAVSQLNAAGVPKAFWTIPDLNQLNAGQMAGDMGGVSPVGGVSHDPAAPALPGAPKPPTTSNW